MPGPGDAASILAISLVAFAAATVGWLLLRQRSERTRRPEAPIVESDRLGRVLENIGDAFVAFDREWRLEFANREAGRLVGSLFARVANPASDSRIGEPRHGQYRIQVHEMSSDEMGGARVVFDRWIELHAHHSDDGVAVYLHDNTERKVQEERARISSFIDDLTGLYNRRGFLTLAEQHLKLAERTGRAVLLLFADIDDFKEINDRFGHQEGDRALAETAHVVREVFRDSDIVARIGGDEFVVLALETSDLSGDILARRLRHALASRNADAERGYTVTFSLGVARFDPRVPAPIADLLARADALMYEHKREKSVRPGRDLQVPLDPPARHEPRAPRRPRRPAVDV